jgi:carbon storage regulator CsrA
MLTLTIKNGKSIRIGNDITLNVIQSDKAGTARLGIDAPHKVPVLRQEAKKRAK